MSNVTPSDLETWGIHLRKPKHTEIDICITHRHHDFLTPFACDYTTVLMKYNETQRADDADRKEANKDRFDELMPIKHGTKAHQHTLFHCIGFPFMVVHTMKQNGLSDYFIPLKSTYHLILRSI